MQRLITFEGVSNFRDLGGYDTEEGGRLRWSRLYRSSNLSGLTEADQQLFEALGIRTVIDLRSAEEQALRPNRIRSPLVRTEMMTIPPQVPAHVAAALPDDETGAAACRGLLTDIYRSYARNYARVIGNFLRTVSAVGGQPVLFHCSAGKDRTGIMSAILLLALDVPLEKVRTDYLLSREHFRPFPRTYPKMVQAVLDGVEDSYLTAFLEEVGYFRMPRDRLFTDVFGLRDGDRRALKNLLVEDG